MEFIDIQEKLLDPLNYYKNELAEKFLVELKSKFEALLKDSRIDVEVNRESVREYDEILSSKEKDEKKLKWVKRASFLIVVAIVYLILLEIDGIQKLRYFLDNGQPIKDAVVKVLGVTFIMVALIILNFKYLQRKKRGLNEVINHLEKVLKEKEEECYSQVEPLLNLFDNNMANQIITDIIPTLVLDEDFKMERYGNLVRNFGLATRLGEDFSTSDIISGEILGNPFIVIKNILNKVENQEYTGSLNVSWTEHYTENGERKSRTVRQTLTASVIKPKQVFENKITLVFGNEAAEHLSFSREAQYVHNLNDKKLHSYIERVQKEIKRRSEKAIKNGGSFLEMGNLEFDALFKALDRDNEVEFRVLFTPIAQRNMINLIKDKEFGDDFNYHKIQRLNNISNDRDWLLNIPRSYYRDFSYDRIEEKYYNINKSYFSNFYRLFLPILSIPIYHQHKSLKYIYGNEFNCNYNPYTSEIMANLLGEGVFSHPESTTKSILKTNTLLTKGDVDLVEVMSKSYKEVQRTDYISVRAGNGKYYDVPINWIDYVPLTSTGKMELKRVNMGEKEFEESIDEEFLRETENQRFAYKNNIFAIFTNKNSISYDKILEKRIKKDRR